MSSITEIDFKNKSDTKEMSEKSEIKSLREVITKQTQIIQEQTQKLQTQEELINMYKRLEHINTCESVVEDKEMIINVPQSILNLPIGTFIQEFCSKNQMREGTALSTILTVTSGFVQNIYKIKPFPNVPFETALGIYYFGDSPSGSGKTPLYQTIYNALNNAKKQFIANSFSARSDCTFPPVFGEGTNGGLELAMQQAGISSFTLESTEKDIVKSLFCLPSNSVSNFSLLLKGWRGEYHQSCRAIRGIFQGKTVYGSLLSLAQEGTVKSIINNDIQNGEFSNGFDARCLFTIEPIKIIESNFLDSNFQDYSETLTNIFYRILMLDYTDVVRRNHADNFDNLIPIELQKEGSQLINDAPKLYRDIFKSKSNQHFLSTFIEKSRIHIQKIAFCLYILTIGFEKKEFAVSRVLPNEYIEMAFYLFREYILNHYNVFRYCELSDEQLEFALILNLFDKKGYYTMRQICDKMRKKPCYIKKYGKMAYKKAKQNVEKLLDEKELSIAKHSASQICRG